MPAIAGEGRALHDAAAAQGIAGVLARRRTSPYLPGSCAAALWRGRSRRRAPGDAGAQADRRRRCRRTAAAEIDGRGPSRAGTGAGARASFRRLPFDDEPDGGAPSRALPRRGAATNVRTAGGWPYSRTPAR